MRVINAWKYYKMGGIVLAGFSYLFLHWSLALLFFAIWLVGVWFEKTLGGK